MKKRIKKNDKISNNLDQKYWDLIIRPMKNLDQMKERHNIFIAKNKTKPKKKKRLTRIVYKLNNTVQIFRLGTTSNDKIEADKKRKIVQSYTFSRDQFDHVLNGLKGMKEFYAKANTNCLNCPFNSANKETEFGLCYTMKGMQYSGFLSSLKSIQKEFKSFDSLPDFNKDIHSKILDICKDTYVRFGTYGEPSLHPIELIDNITNICDTWTGYTHQWLRKPELSAYFMASTHNEFQEKNARLKGFRSFIATKDRLDQFINCPASAEAGYKSTCSKCGLCSGTKGKGNKSIFILNH